MDGVIHVHIERGLLIRALALSSFDRGWIEWYLGTRRNFHSALAKGIVSFRAARREPTWGTSSIVCRKKNSRASYEPFSPLTLREDVNGMSLVFHVCWLRFEVSSFRAPQEDSPRQVFVDVYFCLVLICFVDGGHFKRVILASVEVHGADPAGGLFTLLLRMLDEPIA